MPTATPEVFRRRPCGAALLLLLGGLLGAALSCDYPEQGAYELAALDADGAAIASFPFYVEEITDDSGITTDFKVLLPREGALLELPLSEGADLQERSWMLALAAADSPAGDLDLTLKHAQETLHFLGGYRAPGAVKSAPAAAFGGYVPSGDGPELSELHFTGDAPRVQLSSGAAAPATIPAFSWTIRAIAESDFEAALGAKLATARRVAARLRDPLALEDGAAAWDDAGAEGDSGSAPGAGASANGGQDTDAGQKDKRKVPPLGGRHRSRPR